MKWKDATSYHQGEDRTKVQPRTLDLQPSYWCKGHEERIYITRLNGAPGWYLTARSFGFIDATLGDVPVEEAQRRALSHIYRKAQTLRTRLADFCGELEGEGISL